MTFSCSGGISAELFQKIIAGAALDANVDAQMIQHLSGGADHPIALNFPEGDYLEGAFVATQLANPRYAAPSEIVAAQHDIPSNLPQFLFTFDFTTLNNR